MQLLAASTWARGLRNSSPSPAHCEDPPDALLNQRRSNSAIAPMIWNIAGQMAC